MINLTIDLFGVGVKLVEHYEVHSGILHREVCTRRRFWISTGQRDTKDVLDTPASSEPINSSSVSGESGIENENRDDDDMNMTTSCSVRTALHVLSRRDSVS
jgi:hypothetical protein